MNILDKIASRVIDRRYNKILREMEETESMTYKLLKRIISRGNYDKESMMQKLDVFLLADRITTEEYQELVEMMNTSGDASSTEDGGKA